jgi:cytidine diphosphoramidate kinase
MSANVIWITGLSAAGKTTLAKLMTENLRNSGQSVVMLDGDELRAALGISSSAHSYEARLSLAYKYVRLARLIASQGVTVVVGAVALFKEIHDWNRKHLPGYFEVYLKVPLEELRRRDPKGIYRRYDAGELENVAGLDLKYDEPLKAEVILEYSSELQPTTVLKIVLEEYYKIKQEK